MLWSVQPPSGSTVCSQLNTTAPVTVCCAQVQAAILGLALTHVLQLTGMLQWWTRQTVEVENNMTCVERMVEYTQLPQEPPR